MRITVDGTLPSAIGLKRAQIKAAATMFAGFSAARIGKPFQAITIILHDDDFSAKVHEAINGVKGPTDVITQRYDPMPGELDGVYGEIYVNVDRAIEASPNRRGWDVAKELLLYVAHGMDHLSGADDFGDEAYNKMRRRELKWLKALSKQ